MFIPTVKERVQTDTSLLLSKKVLSLPEIADVITDAEAEDIDP